MNAYMSIQVPKGEMWIIIKNVTRTRVSMGLENENTKVKFFEEEIKLDKNFIKKSTRFSLE